MTIKIIVSISDKGAVIECRTRFEFTPLIFAAEHGHLQVLKLLFVRGAKIDAVTYNGSRPIHKAAQNNRPDIVKFLVQEAGELVNVVSTFFVIFCYSLSG